MDFTFTAEQKKLREEVRSFLEEEIKKGTFRPSCDACMTGFSKEFSRKLGQQGWIGMTWPKEYGGKARSYLDRLIVTEELLRYGAPVAAHWSADRQMGPSLIAYGSDELKAEFLPRFIRGELTFAIGMSEPEAGSDLASLKTQAVRENDTYIINGQKVWTSLAHVAEFCYLVARTDSSAPKHKGISEFIVDMQLPGITIKPITNIAGGKEFNEVFFDNVRVPKRYLVGEENAGWYQITSQLDYERAGIERLMSNHMLFQFIKRYVKEQLINFIPAEEYATVKRKLAQLEIEFEVGRLHVYRVAWLLDQERLPNYEAAMAKDYCARFEQRLANTTLRILGLYGQLMDDSKWALMEGAPARSYLFSPGYTIQGGTSEILRNIIALRGLGLPR